MAPGNPNAAKWVTGPPAPIIVTILARNLELATFILTVVWVFHNLGGLSFHPKLISVQQGQTSNDTGAIFNWHPILMSLAFPVFMSEALLAYTSPIPNHLQRSQRKVVHASMHTAALIAVILGLVATFKSHTLKLPTPTPNLYSPHSYLGMMTFVMSVLQYLAGLGAFLIPKTPGPQKAAYSPIHIFFGRTTYVLGLATMTMGIQEKTTFVQMGKSLQGAGLFSDYLKIPASLVLLLAFTGIFVLYHHMPGPQVKTANDDAVLLEEGTEES